MADGRGWRDAEPLEAPSQTGHATKATDQAPQCCTCLSEIPVRALAQHHTPAGMCPGPAESQSSAIRSGFYLLGTSQSSPASGQLCPPPLPLPQPSPAQPSPSPFWVRPMAVPALGCSSTGGNHPTALAPLKGSAAAEGQRGRSASTSAPGLELPMAGEWSSVTVQNCCSWLQEMPSTGCLCLLSASPSLSPGQHSIPGQGTEGPGQSWCLQQQLHPHSSLKAQKLFLTLLPGHPFPQLSILVGRIHVKVWDPMEPKVHCDLVGPHGILEALMTL